MHSLLKSKIVSYIDLTKLTTKKHAIGSPLSRWGLFAVIVRSGDFRPESRLAGYWLRQCFWIMFTTHTSTAMERYRERVKLRRLNTTKERCTLSGISNLTTVILKSRSLWGPAGWDCDCDCGVTCEQLQLARALELSKRRTDSRIDSATRSRISDRSIPVGIRSQNSSVA